ncbi:C39 family peptidase [Rhodohalobacter sulfatireducens]|uniref:C39 family peptidase n=1 Tax=Rhodohalobacter sulfatireducens TaxID=2911366 RepID=UPI0021059BA4|nr:C39 family peptidase [Rhodohalobacter sulfatireducens]
MLSIPIKPQPNETTCGATCLHTLYQFYGDSIELNTIINEVHHLKDGGTLGALLAVHALNRGYNTTIYSYNLQVFDPTWFDKDSDFLIERLQKQMVFKKDPKLQTAASAYLDFLHLGGKVKFKDLRSNVITKYLQNEQPIMVGLSATYLYKSAREFGPNMDYDDLRGEPSGHFVLLHGYDSKTREVFIADPIIKNPLKEGQLYKMNIDRVMNAILLGIVTYDANLIIITP